jgi:aminoglycoside phosphotransferase (APT) family kinase protein
MSDTRPVRATEQLDWQKIADYLGMSDMQVEQFPGGHSNLTYLLRSGDREMVLRRPPLGPVPPRAHDMAREFRVLQAVHPVFPLAPQPYVLCEDPSVAGAVFYTMERRRGVVIRAAEPPGIDDDLRRGISESVVDTLADLHALEGLESLGKPAGFVARQIRGWTERWHGSKTGEIPEMEQLAAWLEARIPPDPARPSLVHGDYKLDNVMLDASDLRRLAGVFDWEMAAAGDPLVDVGILLCYWLIDAVPTVTTRPGWLGRDEILERYAKRSGASLDNIAVYEVFAVFKLAVVIQQIYARFVRGQTDDPRFAPLGAQVTMLARRAAEMAET